MPKRLLILIFTVFALSAYISGNQTVAPVVDGWQQAQATQGSYRVQKSDTLYSIAFRFGLDYRDLARYNNIPASYEIYDGEELLLSSPRIRTAGGIRLPKMDEAPVVTAKSAPIATPKASPALIINKKAAKTRKVVAKAADKAKARKVVRKTNKLKSKHLAKHRIPEPTQALPSTGHWRWPAKGAVVKRFSASNKGLDIAGHKGEPVVTTAPGVVVYSGNGLPGYGNLVIVKHNAEILSAYAYNSQVLVKEGQKLKAGQVIAKVGSSGRATRRTLLHFEFRRAGKPVNPMKYLSKR